MTDPPGSGETIVVAAAVIRDGRGRILVATRPRGRHMEGLWELPGGKVDAGEDPEAGLVRELCEELGIEVRVGPPITFSIHREPGRRILLLFFEAAIMDGVPAPLEGQQLRWVEPAGLSRLDMPPADAALIAHLQAVPASS
ncbi:MAG: (deoxy)nucleoside triphosphate pyrophosphohydrolase [Acidobacteria bacterium]|nr:(deoxy)nucleoside triphosphate pyrophosphohydrolase [Acidobacteriota bacterium]